MLWRRRSKCIISLNVIFRGALTEKGRFNQRPEESEQESHAALLGKNIPVRSDGKGPLHRESGVGGSEEPA